MSTPSGTSHKAALIVVDMQEDFCPPDGTLAVKDGRSIVSTINSLLALPFELKVATKDWHPPNHISFASNHSGADPFTSFVTITNPNNPSETYETRLWPDHCVQNTPGAEIIPELDVSKLDFIVEKGQHPDIEMYSAFYDPLKNPRVEDTNLTEKLKEAQIIDVFVVGLAADYCVMSTASDAAREGFRTCIVDEGTKAVDEDGWAKCKTKLDTSNVTLVDMSYVVRQLKLSD